jgi:hypothetical protein
VKTSFEKEKKNVSGDVNAYKEALWVKKKMWKVKSQWVQYSVVFKMHDNERVGAEDGENEENGI